ncbi:MAG: hypothetical protein N2044_08505 [Cyclobacteriaceae bacterium]|nr:hypothetical protein [Cyclobacteriaceae bacterium]MCX7637869.1 hypothetical protein [Cyclobacteriaceae bacterium]MDW8330923.1 hypothetical protein [Cyclobacteriaceae bacterium]
MNTERLRQLNEFLKSEPDNVFIRYAIALEHRKSQPDSAEKMLEELLQSKPDYLPALQTVITWKIESDKIEEARSLLVNRAIPLARKQGDVRALRELQTVLNELESA